MGPFPLIPLFPQIALLHFGSADSLLALHQSSAACMSIGMFAFGTFIIMLWIDKVHSTYESTRELARERVRNGFYTYGVGLVFLIFGLYAVAAFVLGLASYAAYAIVKGARVAFAKTA